MLPSDIKPRADYLKPAGDLELGQQQSQKSLRQRQKPPTGKGRVQFSEDNHFKYQTRLRSRKFAEPESVGPPDELRRHSREGLGKVPQSSRDYQLQCDKTKEDELVKYMRNLPGYLQGMETGENFQDTAFNVGVLDWARLEKWKSGQNQSAGSAGNHAVPSTSRSASSKRTFKSSSFTSTPHNKTPTQQIKQHPSLGSAFNSSEIDGLSRGVRRSILRIIPSQDLGTAPASNFEPYRETPRISRSLSRNSDGIRENVKGKCLYQRINSSRGDFSTHLRNRTSSPDKNVRHQNDDVRKVVEKMQEPEMIKPSDQTITLEASALSSSKLGSGRMSLTPNWKLRVGYDETRKKEEMQESDTNLQHRVCSVEPKNIVVLKPRKLSHNSYSQEPQMPNEKMIQESRSKFTDGSSSEGDHSREFQSAIPHSCPPPSKVGRSIHQAMTRDSLDTEFSSGPSHGFLHSEKMPEMLCDGNPAIQNNRDSMDGNVDESRKSFDQELPELAAGISRNSWLHRRFSFSLGRMGRSFSFKESSSSSQFSDTYSVKSGPVTAEASTCFDGGRVTEKSNGHNRTRSSPLRRMLDPLLRSRGSNVSRSAETPFSFSRRPSNVSQSLQTEKLKGLTGHSGVEASSRTTHSIGKSPSTSRAVLQLTVKNGLPLFKFVVENSSSILAATTRNMMSPGKDDLGQNYMFYSVHEIKKKSGSWTSPGRKSKQGGYVYNIIGQMKSCSPNTLNLTTPGSGDPCMMRESALFGVDARQADQAPSGLVPKRELAAIAVQMPVEKVRRNAKHSDEDYGLKQKNFTERSTEDGLSSNLGESKDSGITVILPGGDHSLPIKGAPSPLIDRWKLGGSCDCGGWDVGCRLRVFSDRNQFSKSARTTKAYSKLDCFKLFAQGETNQSRPIFSFAPLTEEIYSVEFDSSVSLLQAFFICVAVMSSRKPSDLSEGTYQLQRKAFQEPIPNDILATKVSNPVLDEFPVKYAPNPPLSPVCRV